MDTKLYVEWRETLKKWVVKFQGRVISQHDTQAEAQQWVSATTLLTLTRPNGLRFVRTRRVVSNRESGANRPSSSHFADGQRSSISFIISSAHRTASEIAATVAGTRLPPSHCASFRAARIAAAIRSTRLRPSSTRACYTFRRLFATKL